MHDKLHTQYTHGYISHTCTTHKQIDTQQNYHSHNTQQRHILCTVDAHTAYSGQQILRCTHTCSPTHTNTHTNTHTCTYTNTH